MNLSTVVCVALVTIFLSKQVVSHEISQKTSRPNAGESTINHQRHLTEDEYEHMSEHEFKSINENAAKTNNDQQHQSIKPEKETNGNSQVVYVNLARVVSEKNDTTRVISSHVQLIKQDGQIACGETNKNGRPSLDENTSSSFADNLNRIVGGNKAEPGEFPYQVRLNIRSRRGSSLCGGVIIDQRHILTAAHCMTTW